MQSRPFELRVWCHRCRRTVALRDVRPWPGGRLVVGTCPGCAESFAAPPAPARPGERDEPADDR